MRLAKLLTVLLLFMVIPRSVIAEETYPALCRVTAQTLNVRLGPSTYYSVIGTLTRNSQVTVRKVVEKEQRLWGEITHNNRTGYVAMQYMVYEHPIEQQSSSAPAQSLFSSDSFSSVLDAISSFLSSAWKVLKYVFIAIGVILLLAFWQNILQIIIFVGIFMGLGALLFHWLFDNGDLGAAVGFALAILIGLRMIVDAIGLEFYHVFLFAYYLLSAPFFYSNRLQHILEEPWRYMFKTDWVSESAKPALRGTLWVIKFLLYIVTTPLRLLNAILYNIFIYGLTELYDLFFEVLQPSSHDEGAGTFWGWLVMLPVRFVRYPLYHGGLALTEGVIWTVVDTFIPAITMYHGTDLKAGQAITSSSMRNEYLRKTSKWTNGTFTASTSSWGGIGVYFASRRSVARRYAEDPYRLSDGNPVMIACRVSLGKIINYALAPYNVYYSAGGNGNPVVLNTYAQKNGYTTGEWWNDVGGYWEYCMFDWKNRYNHPWRIRPVYVFNFSTGRAQHIKGGMRHWLFDKVVFKDICNCLKAAVS